MLPRTCLRTGVSLGALTRAQAFLGCPRRVTAWSQACLDSLSWMPAASRPLPRSLSPPRCHSVNGAILAPDLRLRSCFRSSRHLVPNPPPPSSGPVTAAFSVSAAFAAPRLLPAAPHYGGSILPVRTVRQGNATQGARAYRGKARPREVI